MLADFPDIFIANVKPLTNCTNIENFSVEYPNPGKEVERGSNRRHLLKVIVDRRGLVIVVVILLLQAQPPRQWRQPSPTPSDTSTGNGKTYTVVDGDNCARIAKTHSISVEHLMTNNPKM